ncbi:FGGY carbohydrate kinase domain-containing protein-like [Chanodichthys erythropterus]|uniref:FGGY carbohydrate kinase domain-containing protein-like n=1 Tax=Chanodichthys erythropterus TaxID=933992 RepID=UPI00351F27A9
MVLICGTSSCHMAVSSSSCVCVCVCVCSEHVTTGLHVWPDFHRNRSPLADQMSRGSVVGLTLSQTLDDLALLYLATLQAIALGTRHIIDAMREAGHDITTLFLCGGLSKNALFVQTHANITGSNEEDDQNRACGQTKR